MTADAGKPESGEAKNEAVVEKRLKPTLIRRRASVAKPEALPAPATPETPAITPTPAVSATPAPSAEVSTPAPRVVTTGVPRLVSKPGEGRIGVVGHIEIVAPKVKEDWRERQQIRAPKKKRSREEIEMESIQRVGGLKHYADIVQTDIREEDVPVEAEVPVPVVEERVFRPQATGRRRKATRREFKKTALTESKAIKKVIRIDEGLSVAGLSQATGAKTSDIIKKLMDLGIMATANQTIEVETAAVIAQEYGYTVERTAFKEEDFLAVPEAHVSVQNLKPRPPIVTVMGHVDHGKTSLLDAIRQTTVADAEVGGITQRIGAYEVAIPKGTITFIDTPGHEAFTAMRARGAGVTDIVILVVAADDGIMPQTIEAIAHAKAAEVPIIVAINKIDKPDAQPDRVKQSLTEHGLVPEEWGGEVICVPTSAKTKVGIEKLLEMVLLQAEVMELKADSTLRPRGAVIEARLDRGRGPVATTLIHEGELKVGQFIVCGLHYGKVRAMTDAFGKTVVVAGPAKPVEILGLSGVPEAGDELIGVADESAARLVIEVRRDKERRRTVTGSARVSLEELNRSVEEGVAKELNVVIKADAHGSLEAIADALTKLATDAVRVNVLHQGVGGITESDVMLAAASAGVIIGFTVQPDAKAREAASREGVDIRTYRIIYEMIDEVKKAMAGLLAPQEVERLLGRADVREVFRISKLGNIAGSMVASGKITRSARARLLRDQVVVFDGRLASLRRFKDDAREVTEGQECGIGLERFEDIKVGDVIEAYVIDKKAAVF